MCVLRWIVLAEEDILGLACCAAVACCGPVNVFMHAPGPAARWAARGLCSAPGPAPLGTSWFQTSTQMSYVRPAQASCSSVAPPHAGAPVSARPLHSKYCGTALSKNIKLSPFSIKKLRNILTLIGQDWPKRAQID